MYPITLSRFITSCTALLGLLLFLPGCNNELEAQNNHLREEIIRVHDLAMAKIGYMYELEIKLQDILPPDSSEIHSIKTSVANLQKANKMMFDWMHQYQTLAVAGSLEADNRYREQQLVFIKEVQRITDESIEMSEKILATSR